MRRLLVLLVCLSPLAWADTSALIGKLHSSDPKVKAQAALALGALKSKRAVPYLIDCLRDSSSMVRGSCARALGMIRDDEAIAVLSQLGRDPSEFVRKWSRWALARCMHKDTELSVLLMRPRAPKRRLREDLMDAMILAVKGFPGWEFAGQRVDFSEKKGKEEDDEGIEGIEDDEPEVVMKFSAELDGSTLRIMLEIGNQRLEGSCTPKSLTKGELVRCIRKVFGDIFHWGER